MRTTFVFLAALAAFAAAIPLPEGQKDFEYPRYIQFPDGEGVPQTVDLHEELDMTVLEQVQRNPERNLYLLYTRRNPTTSQTLEINNSDSILNSNFDSSAPTVVVVHGWLSNQNTNINPIIRDAYLNKGETNVIILDWRRLAFSGYVTAVNGVPAVGRGLGQFLRFLHQVTGVPYSSMHLVGFSLGAHLVGNAGRELGGAVARVTGEETDVARLFRVTTHQFNFNIASLDPAGPLWNLNRNRLGPNDGIYVEAIHTDGGYTVGGLGIGTNIADSNFYPNGGISQPGCLTNICNHNRSWELFASSVSYNHFVGRECASNWQLTWNSCRGNELRMGNDILWKTGSGMYRLDTARRYPF